MDSTFLWKTRYENDVSRYRTHRETVFLFDKHVQRRSQGIIGK